ncbi:MAG: hypothetical protein KBD55_00015 [Candidatus Pacebacteria bacterium]|jgi:hypothetical protein|nr:hypothetical protein [Candidatus Paceibacterota bacterium]
MKNFPKNGGISILGIVLLGFLLILVLSYYNIRIQSVVESPTAQDNLNYVGDNSRSFWDKYLAAPAHYLWHDVWVNIFWHSFIDNAKRLRDGNGTELQDKPPVVNYGQNHS